MKNLLKIIILILIVLVNIAIAFEPEIIVKVGDKEITNIDVFKEKAKHQPEEMYYNSRGMCSILEDIVDPMLFEYYAMKKNLMVTEQEVLNSLEEEGRQRGYASVEEYFQKQRGKYDKDIYDWQRYKGSRKSMLERRITEHFDPNINNLTEKDIQEYIESEKKSFSSFAPWGHPEEIKFRCILTGLADESARKELESVKDRINHGESFDKIAAELKDKKEYSIDGLGNEPNLWVRTSEFKKEGIDSLMPWSSFKGKAVFASFTTAMAPGQDYLLLIKVEDYRPDSRKNVEDALNDKDLREEVLIHAKGHKFMNARRRLLNKLRNEEAKYVDYKEKICQKLADDYIAWWADTYKNAPDFQERYDKLKASEAEQKAKDAERARRKNRAD